MTEENDEDEGQQGETPRGHNLQRVGKLRTLRDIAIECGRLYRRAAKGLIPSADASRQASILAVMKTCLEASDTEARVDALEKAAEQANAPTPIRLRVV
jgi:hypothetical protein